MNREVFNEGPTTSQHIESTSDDHFQESTYELKRTRSMGMLDDYIKPISKDESKAPGGITKKITSRDFVSDETLRRLNIKPIDDEISAHVPSFYTSVLPPSARKKGVKQNSNSPSSFQSEEFFDENCNSEDSLSSLGSASPNSQNNKNKNNKAKNNKPKNNKPKSAKPKNCVNLTPKHLLRKQQQLQETQQRYEKEQNQRLHTINGLRLKPNKRSGLITHNIEYLHDDIDICYVAEEHVDYFSYKWADGEINKSWRYVIDRKPMIANASRLENSSWRQWAQFLMHLKKLAPEEINWSKDSDVDWLYGPVLKTDKNDFGTELYFIDQQNRKESQKEKKQSHIVKKAAEPRSSSSSSFCSVDGNNEQENESLKEQPKSILKTKSNSQKLISESSYSKLQYLLEQNERKLAASGSGSSPILETTENSLLSSPHVGPSPPASGPVEGSSPIMLSDNLNSIDEEMSDSPISKPETPKKDRHIHFNMRVDQCIAVDEYSTDYSTDFDYDSEENENQSSLILTQAPYEDHDYPIEEEDAEDRDQYANGDIDDYEEEYEDEDDIFVLNPKSKLSSISHHPHNNAEKISTGAKSVFTISPLPATTLKNCSDDENEVELETVSHSAKSGRGYDYYYDFNSVYDPSTYHQDLDDIQMYDVPEDCQLDDNMDIDTSLQSPLLPAATTIQQSPILYSAPDFEAHDIPIDIQSQLGEATEHDIPTNIQNQLGSCSDGGIYDVPESLQAQMGTSALPVTPTSFMSPEYSASTSDVKRTPSVGGSSTHKLSGFSSYSTNNLLHRNTSLTSDTTTIHSSPSGSVSTIKVGLSGLDLSSAGLRRSTGAGSRPQLFQMAQQQQQQQQIPQQQAPISSHSSFITRSNSSVSNNRKAFSFDDSDDSFSEEHETEEDEDDEDDEDEDDNGGGFMLTTRSHSNINLNKSTSFLLSNFNKENKF